MIIAIILLIAIVVGALVVVFSILRSRGATTSEAVDSVRELSDGGLKMNKFSVVVVDEQVADLFADFPRDAQAYVTSEGVEDSWEQIRSDSQVFAEHMRDMSERVRREAGAARRGESGALREARKRGEDALENAGARISAKLRRKPDDDAAVVPVTERVHAESVESEDFTWKPGREIKFPTLAGSEVSETEPEKASTNTPE